MTPTETGIAPDLIRYDTASGQQRRGKTAHAPACDEAPHRQGRLRCSGCAEIWAKDRRLTILRGAEVYSGRVAMITVTAPGTDLLPWACTDDHKHDGRAGCKVEIHAAMSWNLSAQYRWKRLWQAVSNRLGEPGTVILAKVWEPQGRGVAHLHFMVPLHLEKRITELLREMGPDYGFGFIDNGARGRGKLRPGATADDAARYLASYIGSGGKVASVLDGIRQRVVPSRSFYVAKTLTDASGCTMRSLRLRRRAWAVHMGLSWPPGWVDDGEWRAVMETIYEELMERGPPDASRP